MFEPLVRWLVVVPLIHGYHIHRGWQGAPQKASPGQNISARPATMVCWEDVLHICLQICSCWERAGGTVGDGSKMASRVVGVTGMPLSTSTSSEESGLSRPVAHEFWDSAGFYFNRYCDTGCLAKFLQPRQRHAAPLL